MTPRDDGAGGKPVRLLSARGFHIDTQFISESPRTRYDQHHTLVSPNRTVGKKRFPIFRVTDVGGERLLCHGIHLTIDRSIDVKKKNCLIRASHLVGRSDQMNSQFRAFVPLG